MQMHHWFCLAIALIVGYVVGVKYPQLAAAVGL